MNDHDPAHPSNDELADHAAGEGTPTTAAHVASCGECATTLRSLEAATATISSALAELPAEPMPADVAAWIDAALAAEPMPAESGNVVPLAAPRRRTLPPWAAAAAAAVVLVGGGAVVLGNTTFFSGRGSTAANSSAGGLAESAPVISTTGFDYSATSLPTRLAGLLAGKQEAAPQANDQAGIAGAPLAAASAPSPTSAAKSVGTSGGTAQRSSGTLAATSEQQLAALRKPAALAACLVRALGADLDPPLAVDLASFDGTPAVIVALPTPGRTDRLDIYVLDPGCPEGAFRYFARLPRPTPR